MDVAYFYTCALAGSIVLGCAMGRAADRFDSSGADFYKEWNAPALPAPGEACVHLLSPSLLEVVWVGSARAGTSTAEPWGFLGKDPDRFPLPESVRVLCAGDALAVVRLGLKRRVLYAPIKHRDLRVANAVYVQLGRPVPDNKQLEITNPDAKLWPKTLRLTLKTDPHRWSPVLHVNQTGYLPSESKVAIAGYYLGSMGEMDLPGALATGGSTPGQVPFKLMDAKSGAEVFSGTLEHRPDSGFPFPCYLRVYQADFTAFNTPGEYRLFVPGAGTSFPFAIDYRVAGAFARTCALGLYHQRCGTNNVMPFTRFVHDPCHTQPAEVSDTGSRFKAANQSLEKETEKDSADPRRTAPRLKNVASSLYPFIRKGPVDVSRGHHDAGDYSKYTINSAAFVHHLVFAADALPGVRLLDNLGIPESGDGKSDILQEAKWEADFLEKMQDQDGGFYFLVYPREREYENDVTPDHGDPQVVFPKTTSATAAAVAALAQCASSPTFKEQFPESARSYLAAAKRGWEFLERAIAKYGKDGAYQKITHYGNEFGHDDELAWAACEMFLATQEPAYHKRVQEWLNPAAPATRRWGWLRLYEAYGCATRSYAFGARTGRVSPGQLSPLLLEACENEIAAAGEDQLRRARESAYGTSFPVETKRVLTAGWYFSSDAAFDLAVACQVPYPALKDPRKAMRAAILSNLNYEQGCNPVNVVYLTGLGWKRQREIVHQFAQNDRRIMPVTGIPLGNVQGGFGWNYVYDKELDLLSFPADGDASARYPIYDRWGDGFNLRQEFVILNQARALGYLCWLMAETPLRSQEWNSASATISPAPNQDSKGPPKFELRCSTLDLSSARLLWEMNGAEPSYGMTSKPISGQEPSWIEAEAQALDGRRVFGVRGSARE